MSLKVTKSVAVEHPEGWFPFKIVNGEIADGKYGQQIKFRCNSSEKNEEGENIELTYYTGTKLSKHENCKLTALYIACGVYSSEDDIEDETDAEILFGKVFEGRVDQVGQYFNIGAVRRPKTSKKPKPEKAEYDPFESQ